MADDVRTALPRVNARAHLAMHFERCGRNTDWMAAVITVRATTEPTRSYPEKALPPLV